MAYTSFWFEPSTPLFPVKEVVLDYIRRYADHFNLRKHVRLNTRVQEALWIDGLWRITLQDGIIERFDKVIVANGHYGVPRHPNVPGVESWFNSGRATHSVYFRNEEPYKDQIVLVIGNGPSGRDICAEVSTVARTVYHSVTDGIPKNTGNIRHRGRVTKFQEDGTVFFDDGGPPSDIIDHAILATGYVMSFPFLPQMKQGKVSQIPPLPNHLINTSYSVFPLARHVFPLQDNFPPTSLAFVGLLVRVVPLPLFEAQARYIAKVFQTENFLDRSEEARLIIQRYRQLEEQFGGNPLFITKYWHVVPDSVQFKYRKELQDLAEAPAECYPEDWVSEIYSKKDELRQKWRRLEKEGRAEVFVKGVGEGGRHEWVDMMRRMLTES